MKKFFTGVSITMIIAAIFLVLGTTLNAQIIRYDSNLTAVKHEVTKEDVKVNIKVYLQDLDVETSSVEFSLYSGTSRKTHKCIINNDFTVYLLPDTQYLLTFTHPGFNTRSVMINTTTPAINKYVIDLAMRLYNDLPGGLIGNIYYDKKLDNFQAVGNVQNTTK